MSSIWEKGQHSNHYLWINYSTTHTHDVWKMENIGILYHKQRWVIFLIVACSPMGPCTYYSNSRVMFSVWSPASLSIDQYDNMLMHYHHSSTELHYNLTL